MQHIETTAVKMIRNGAPRLIHSEDQLSAYTEELMMLTSIEEPDAEEIEAIDLLTLLIETYERQAYALPNASPIEVLQVLMDANGLKQKDLQPEIGSVSNISLIMSGRRNLTLAQMEALASRFNVDRSAFLGVPKSEGKQLKRKLRRMIAQPRQAAGKQRMRRAA